MCSFTRTMHPPTNQPSQWQNCANCTSNWFLVHFIPQGFRLILWLACLKICLGGNEIVNWLSMTVNTVNDCFAEQGKTYFSNGMKKCWKSPDQVYPFWWRQCWACLKNMFNLLLLPNFSNSALSWKVLPSLHGKIASTVLFMRILH